MKKIIKSLSCRLWLNTNQKNYIRWLEVPHLWSNFTYSDMQRTGGQDVGTRYKMYDVVNLRPPIRCPKHSNVYDGNLWTPFTIANTSVLGHRAELAMSGIMFQRVQGCTLYKLLMFHSCFSKAWHTFGFSFYLFLRDGTSSQWIISSRSNPPVETQEHLNKPHNFIRPKPQDWKRTHILDEARVIWLIQ